MLSSATVVPGAGLRICNAQVKTPSAAMVTFSLPEEAVGPAPLVVELTGSVAGDNVSQPPQSYNGVKFNFVWASPNSATHYDGPGGLYGTFARRNLSINTNFDDAVESAKVVLGLQDSTGCVVVASVSLVVRSCPTGWEYDTGVSTRLRGTMVATTITPASIATLGKHGWGANFMRWQLADAGLSTADTTAWWPLVRARLDLFDAMTPNITAAGIVVLLDLHSIPGGFVNGTTSEMMQFSPGMLDAFVDLWRRIALRYRGQNRPIWAFDLLNEPSFGAKGQVSTWEALAERTTRAIREVDPLRYVVISWTGDFPPIRPMPLPRVVYTIHVYHPHCFTHQGVYARWPYGVQYPNPAMACDGGRAWNISVIRQDVQRTLAFSRRYHIGIVVGEFSAVRWAPDGSAYRYLQDLIQVLEENRWHWSYHAFREWHGWSVEIGENMNVTSVSATPTQRQQLLQHYFGMNADPYAEASVSSAALECMRAAERLETTTCTVPLVGPTRLDRLQEASDQYKRAAVLFKTTGHSTTPPPGPKQGECIEATGEELFEAAQAYANAAACYGRCGDDAQALERAVVCHERAKDLYVVDGLFTSAAKELMDAGALCDRITELEAAQGERLRELLERSVAFYLTAEEMYSGEQADSKSVACLAKAARRKALLSDYAAASALFERCSQVSSERSSLLATRCARYYLRSVVCLLAAGDCVAAAGALERYALASAPFAGSREAALCTALVRAVGDYDEEAFTGALAEWDAHSRIKRWLATVLKRAKDKMLEESGAPSLV
eukprot:m51a1_g1581 hypothetical protein (781) ;mRNA; f:114467-117306